MSFSKESRENLILPVSYKQYKKLSKEFMEKAITLLDANGLYIEVHVYTREGLKAPYSIKDKVLNNISLLSKKEFNAAAMVKINMYPLLVDHDIKTNEKVVATFKDCNPRKSSLELTI